jgi:hypothetical protein
MANFNDLISASKRPLSDLIVKFQKGDIFVDNTYQRRSVLRNKIRLIETILRGYPIPEIYLWAGKANPRTGLTKLSVVDGQQRLTAIRDYIAGDFALDKKALDPQPSDASYKDKQFNELTTKDKQAIWSYNLTVRTIPEEIDMEGIVTIFSRLNETDKSLNPQELRNAQFNGLFIQTVEVLADLPFWEKHKIFNAAAIRRMGDIQFVSSLLMFLRSGIEEEVDQKSINKMYDTYNDAYPDQQKDTRTAKAIIKIIGQVFAESEEVAKFFKSPVHLYSLFIVVYQHWANKKPVVIKGWASRLETFAAQYKRTRPPTTVARYKAAATEGTQKRSNREDRVRYLRASILKS